MSPSAMADSARLLETVEEARVHDHLCVLYRTQDEALAAAQAFMRAGLKANQKCVYVADDNSIGEVVRSFNNNGIDVEAATRSGQLVLATKRESYLRDGYFDPRQAIDFFAETSVAALADGWQALRGNAEMTWQLGGDPGTGRLIEYESQMNTDLFPSHQVIGICQYNIERFSAATIRHVLQTHPRVVVGNMVCKNFYYTPPDQFTAEDDAETDVERMLNNLHEFERSEQELRRSRVEVKEANSHLEEKVQKRTRELEHKTQELQNLNRNLAGREYRIRELEREVALLRARITRGPE